MTETAKYKLKKPGYEDYADIETLNENADIMDAALAELDTGKAAASHKHSASDINSGTIPVARGGTGLTESPSMLVNLASTAAANIMSASPRPGVIGTLPVARGGTGVTSLSALAAALEPHLGSVKIATGSYVGTGTYGVNNPISLTFNFQPKIVIIRSEGISETSYLQTYGVVFFGVGVFCCDTTTTYQKTVVLEFGNTVKFYGSTYDQNMNANGYTYYYFAVG